jgi:hypothetical protein
LEKTTTTMTNYKILSLSTTEGHVNFFFKCPRMKVTSKIIEARKVGNGRKRVMMAPWHHPQTPKNTPTNSIAKQTRKIK